jgi:hypothetical protein
MKKDPEYGAEDLEIFGQMCLALGTVFYCILGGFMMANTGETNP